MFPVACGNCRSVAPLIARYNDPDLSEAERVLLSTHLFRCPHCLGQLQEYRALDHQVRRMPGITLAPQVREVLFDHLAAPMPGFGIPGFAVFGRQAWIGAATAFSLTALVIVFSIGTFRATQQADGALTGSEATGHTLVRPLTTTILGANPTQVASTVGESLSGTMVIGGLRSGATLSAVTPLLLRATVREVNARDGRLVVLIDGSRVAESLIIDRATTVVWADGRPASLADIAAGATIQVQREQPTAGGAVARQIILTR